MASWSGLFDHVYGDGPYVMQFNRPSTRRAISRLLKRRGMHTLRELMIELTGATAGGTALVERTRIQHSADPGGLRTIETVTTLDRVTTSADETDIDSNVLQGLFSLSPASYPVDKSGNSGGGLVGY